MIDELSFKGAFYRYFDSKAALLEGVVSRMVEAATAQLVACLVLAVGGLVLGAEGLARRDLRG